MTDGTMGLEATLTAADGVELPAVLTVEEVASLLRVDRKTAYAAVVRGEVPGVRRLGRCIRISRDAVLRWLADGEDATRRRRRTAA
jgi:excisionase family DNA binding protein